MLDEWLKVAYAQDVKKQSETEAMGLLEQLPTEELRKLADGTPIAKMWPHLEKTAYSDCAPVNSPSGPVSWLDQFKGTPLLEQAIALEQEELQAEMTDMQRRQEQRAQSQSMDTLWDMKDRIRMKKRLLELEKVKQESGQTAEAQGAGAPGPVPAEGVQDSSSGLMGGVDKRASAKEKVAWAEQVGRALAQHNFEKAAHAELVHTYGDRAGVVLAKLAFSPSALSGLVSKVAPAAKSALSIAKANPALAGAAIGAAGGAMAGGPGHRLSGAMGGAALGGGAGHVAAGGGGQMGQQVRSAVSSGLGKARGMLGGAAPQLGA